MLLLCKLRGTADAKRPRLLLAPALRMSHVIASRVVLDPGRGRRTARLARFIGSAVINRPELLEFMVQVGHELGVYDEAELTGR